jgi:Zn-dependent membrane protease YugP
MIGFDPVYFIFLAPALLLGFWAQARVKWAIAHGNQIRASAGITGAEVAQKILDSYHVRGVGIERLGTNSGDHYDPTAKVLRLSEDVYSGRSIS